MMSERYTLKSNVETEYIDWNKSILHMKYILEDAESHTSYITLKCIEILLNKQDARIKELEAIVKGDDGE